jgi:uncharacterized membrane protein
LLQDARLPWAGFATALCWSISPILVREGLEDLDSPVLGVTIGMVANVIAYGILVYIQRDKWQGQPIARTSFNWQFLAGIFVGLATWARWVALDLTEVGVVLAIGRINVPLVLVLSMLMLDQKHERITLNVWLGAGLILAGSMVLIFVE